MIVTGVLLCTASNVLAWWDGVVDTANTQYSSGQLSEQFQRFTFSGNERTYKYGFYRSWYENGQLEWEGQYANDKKTGTWVHWDSTGRKTEEMTYHVGFKHGLEIEWNPDGTMNKALCYRSDKLHGLSIWYSPGNSILTEFNNPCLTILAQKFYVDGVMLLPIMDSTSNPCADGLYGGKEPYHYEENDVWIEWDKDNTKFHVGRKIDDKKNGLWILWSSTGDMIKADYYKAGTPLD